MYLFFVCHRFHFPAQLVGGFTLSGLLLDKPWSQVVVSPPVRALFFFVAHRVRHFHCPSIFIEYVANSRFRAFRYYRGPQLI